MSNWNKPDLSSTEVDAISEYKGRDIDNAVMFDAGVISNIPENAIRFNVATGLFQRRQSGAWVDKLVSVAGGGTGSSTASGARSNLGLGAVAVESVLPIAKGGTGQTTALAGLNALGGRNASNLNTGTVAVARLPNATTSVAGISQLSNSTTSDSQTLSATARAVKNVQDDVNLKLTASLSLSDVASALAARENINAHNAANLTTGTIPNARITNATTSIAGITQLVNSTTNSSQTGAATANSVKLVADRSVGAGNGLIGGGSLQSSRTITMGTPSTLSGGSANSVSGTTHTHAISSTASRTDTSTSTLLEAKGMNDHRVSGDHDDRYYTKTQGDSRYGQIPSGTRMLFQQTAAPTGWTKITSDNNKALRVVSGTAGSGGANAFTTAFNSNRNTTSAGSHGHTASSGDAGSHSHTITVNNHTLSVAQMPSHNHPIRWLNTAGNNSPNSARTSSSGNIAQNGLVQHAGGGGSHNHGASSNSRGVHSHTVSIDSNGSHTHSTNLDVQYLDVIIAEKN